MLTMLWTSGANLGKNMELKTCMVQRISEQLHHLHTHIVAHCAHETSEISLLFIFLPTMIIIYIVLWICLNVV